jgi:hypothetical protein
VIEEHVGIDIFDIIVANNQAPEVYNQNIEAVRVEEDLKDTYAVYLNDLIDRDHPWRHDPQKVTRVLMDLFRERTGPLATG